LWPTSERQQNQDTNIQCFDIDKEYPTMTKPTDLLTVTEAAQLLNLKVSTVRQWVWLREIDYFKLKNRSIRIPREALEKLLKEGERPAVDRRR
jgi:excisionase family DNA binding protein